ncbi:glycosyl amidation-associated protein WbuZ [soil metagenome]
MNHRIIARLDIKGPNLVKGIHLEGLRVLGKPEHFAKYYYEAGADELMFTDVVASLYERNSLEEIITKVAKEVFIPLTVGGGIRTIDDIKKAFRAGADKVSINTAAIKNPFFIREATKKFGSSNIVITIEAIKHPDGKYYAYTDNGREETGVEVIEWAKKAEELGAGELIITSVDLEGTGQGFDLELTKSVSDAVSIPVVAHGGAGNAEDIKNVINEGKADAVAIASILHYSYAEKYLTEHTVDFKAEGNTSFLNSGKNYSKIVKTRIEDIKDYLKNNNVDCRVTL